MKKLLFINGQYINQIYQKRFQLENFQMKYNNNKLKNWNLIFFIVLQKTLFNLRKRVPTMKKLLNFVVSLKIKNLSPQYFYTITFVSNLFNIWYFQAMEDFTMDSFWFVELCSSVLDYKTESMPTFYQQRDAIYNYLPKRRVF